MACLQRSLCLLLASCAAAQELFVTNHPAARGAPSELLERIQQGQDHMASIAGSTPRPKHYARHLSRGRRGHPRGRHIKGSLRVSPIDHGGDPTGIRDSTDALLKSVEACYNRSIISPNGVFPGSRSFGNGKVVRDMGGCYVDLKGGEYRISKTIDIPEYTANMQMGFGSIVAGPDFPQDDFLITVGGVSDGCRVPQASCNIDINFPELFLDGSHRASAMQINHVMGVTIGPGGYLLNFTKYGIQIQGGHEVMTDRIWLGETNFDFDYRKEGRSPNATAIEINGNDHYILNTIVFSSKVGVAVHGAADYVEGTHVWFPNNVALAFKDDGAMAFYVTNSGNRFNGCYIDGGRAVFTGNGLKNNIWINGFECCARVKGVNHGLILKGDHIGPGLHITHNIFGSGSIIHESSTAVDSSLDCKWDAPVGPIKQCNGLHHMPNGDKSADACEQACCSDVQCGVFQWADSKGGTQEGGCFTAGRCGSEHVHNVSWVGATRSVGPSPSPSPSPSPAAVVVTDVRIEDNYFDHGGKGSKASLTQDVSNATGATFDFCNRLIFSRIAAIKVSVVAESGFPHAVARPANGCKVSVETDIPMTGAITVDVDSSEHAGYLI